LVALALVKDLYFSGDSVHSTGVDFDGKLIATAETDPHSFTF
jgi:hypothetical protein